MTGSSSRPATPVWVDLASTNAPAARAFYAHIFGWDVHVEEDPQYGGYAMARVDGKDAAGIGPAQPGQPSAWTVYLGTDDADALSADVAANGGEVVLPPMQIGDVGRMGIIRDPSGAFLGIWQPQTMRGFTATGAGAYTWAELNARGFETTRPFYENVFGWSSDAMPFPGGEYTRFSAGGPPFAGGLEMHPGVPEQVPSYWMIYFAVADADATYAKAMEAGASEMLSPSDFPGGRFAILADPTGAMFAIRSQAAG